MMNEKEVNSEQNTNFLSPWKKRLFRMVQVLVLLFFLYWSQSFFPELSIGMIQVQGTNQLTKEEVLASAGLADTKNVFSISRSSVVWRLEQDARIEVLHEGYQWPLVYMISIRERAVFAYIPTKDGFIAVDHQGKVLHIQRRFSYMHAPLITGVLLPSQLIGDICEDPSVRIGINFLVKLSEQGVTDLSELDLSNLDSVQAYTLHGIPVFLGDIKELEEKSATVSQVLKEVARSNQKVRYMDLKSKAPVVKFE